MYKLIGILLASFLFTFIAAVPFINILYKLKFQRKKEIGQKDIFGKTTSIVSSLHAWKVGTPNAGGLLIIASSILLSGLFYALSKFSLNAGALILYLTLVSFGLLGFYDDIRKFYKLEHVGVWGLRLRFKFLIQWVIAFAIAYLIFSQMHIDYMTVPLLGKLALGTFFIPFAAFTIVAMSNAVNITDGLDGLALGLSVIALSALWVVSDQPHLSDVQLFIGVILGSCLAFLYFNIFPARVWIGDTGALALGAMLAAIALITDNAFVLPIIGGVFVIEIFSVVIQWTSKAIRKKKVFLSAPIHHHFEAKGWDETKVTMRFWLAGAFFAFLGLFFAFLMR